MFLCVSLLFLFYCICFPSGNWYSHFWKPVFMKRHASRVVECLPGVRGTVTYGRWTGSNPPTQNNKLLHLKQCGRQPESFFRKDFLFFFFFFETTNCNLWMKVERLLILGFSVSDEYFFEKAILN